MRVRADGVHARSSRTRSGTTSGLRRSRARPFDCGSMRRRASRPSMSSPCRASAASRAASASPTLGGLSLLLEPRAAARCRAFAGVVDAHRWASRCSASSRRTRSASILFAESRWSFAAGSCAFRARRSAFRRSRSGWWISASRATVLYVLLPAEANISLPRVPRRVRGGGDGGHHESCAGRHRRVRDGDHPGDPAGAGERSCSARCSCIAACTTSCRLRWRRCCSARRSWRRGAPSIARAHELMSLYLAPVVPQVAGTLIFAVAAPCCWSPAQRLRSIRASIRSIDILPLGVIEVSHLARQAPSASGSSCWRARCSGACRWRITSRSGCWSRASSLRC